MIVCLLSDPTLTPSNIRAALDTLPANKWEEFGAGLDFPRSKLDQIMSLFTSDEERKDEVIRMYPTQHPHPTWEHVSDALYGCGFVFDDQQFHNVLDRLQSMFPTGKLHSALKQLKIFLRLDFHVLGECEL